VVEPRRPSDYIHKGVLALLVTSGEERFDDEDINIYVNSIVFYFMQSSRPVGYSSCWLDLQNSSGIKS
jgi:hypothetical protein